MRLRLDVPGVDLPGWEPHVARCADAGYTFVTVADLGDSLVTRRRLYELNRRCAADVPGRGAFFTWEDYVVERFAPDRWLPGGAWVAVHDHEWVGMSAFSDHRDRGYLFVTMTGVAAGHRRRGLATALKVRGIGTARALGVDTIRTFHAPQNTAMIALNRRLGYVDA